MLRLMIYVFTLMCITTFNVAFSQTNKKESVLAELPAVTIRSSRYSEIAEKATYKVDILTQKDIQQSGATSVQDLLKKKIPSVQSFQRGGSFNFIAMQGLDSRYIKILVDGVPVTGDIYGRGLPLENLALEGIERIEISRGGGSASFGSDAFAGVIQIFTQKNQYTESLGLSMDHRYTYKHAYQGSMSLYQNRDRYSWDVSVGGNYNDGRPNEQKLASGVGPFTWYELPREFAFFQNSRLGFQGDFGQFILQSKYRYHEDYNTQDYDATGAGWTEKHNYGGSFHWQKEFKREVFVKSYLAFNGYRHDLFDSDVVTEKVESSELQVFSDIHSESSVRAPIGQVNELISGIDYKGEWLKYEGIEKGLQNDQTASLFFEDRITPLKDNRLVIIPGVRLIFNPDYKIHFSPMLPIKYQPVDWFSIRFAYNYNYKTPRLKQKHRLWVHPPSENFLLRGNTSLKPEKGHSYQVSMDIKKVDFSHLAVEFFYHDLRDVIDSEIFSSDSGIYNGKPYIYIREYLNFQKGFSRGGTLSLKGDVIKDYLRYFVAYTYTDAKNFDGEDWVTPVGHVLHSVKFEVGGQLPKVKTDLSLSGEWNSGLYRDDDRAPKYFILDLSVSQPLFKHYTLYGGVKNLLNNTEEEYDLYDGLTGYIGFRMRTSDIKKNFKKKGKKWND